ncbi:PIN domain-containing protein [Pseudonocardia sp. DSM 110487]|uniref:PIN domain-containing protein n=1 Tax=Pseudonocardia sp. DSM 110487 TaxID=2865833 RepID=UPI002106F56B|nr:PIN domain-containing protein [Pseudonocardia sp. DSM 110487]
MIVVDTGPIVALINDRDDHHVRCRDFLAHYPGPLLVPTTVFTEVCMLVERRRGTHAELAFLADVRSGLFTMLEAHRPISSESPSWSRSTPIYPSALWTRR